MKAKFFNYSDWADVMKLLEANKIPFAPAMRKKIIEGALTQTYVIQFN